MALLLEKRLCFAAAESCTGGDIARRFTELPGDCAFDRMRCWMQGLPVENR